MGRPLTMLKVQVPGVRGYPVDNLATQKYKILR